MDNQSSNSFHILWIEEQLLQLQAGVDELSRILQEKLSRRIEIIKAEWVAKAEEEIDKLKDAPPDLIVLDLMLPRTEENFKWNPPLVDLNAGFIVWHRLRRQKEWGDKIAGVPILLVTALSRPLFRPMMEADNKLKWLEKPVGPSTMAEEIIRLFGDDAAGKAGQVS